MIPLSTKMRPSTLDGFVGQTHFLFEGSLFYNSIKNKTFDSAIFLDRPVREKPRWRGSLPANWTVISWK